jgi:hypothetical protein
MSDPNIVSIVTKARQGAQQQPADDGEQKRLNELSKRIELVHFSDIKLNTECRHLVDHMVPRRGLVIVWGPPKCGKSFWVYDLMMHVSRGLRYHGRDVVQGPVIYCMFEGQGGADTRKAAYEQEILKGDDPGQFFVETLPLDLIKDHQALIMAIKRKLGDVKPVAITLDTLNRSLVGSESNDEDMAAYIRAAGAIIDAFDCAVIVVHHCGHNGDRPRGHSSLLGAEDAELMVKRQGDDKTIVAEVTRMKDGPEGEKIAFTLRSVIVGKDSRGNDLTSCVVEACEGNNVTAYGKQWPAGLTLVRDAIAEAVLQHGKSHRVCGDGPAVKAVPVDAARVVHNQRYTHNGEGKRAEAERKAWSRNLGKARAANLVGGEHKEGQDLIWLT